MARLLGVVYSLNVIAWGSMVLCITLRCCFGHVQSDYYDIKLPRRIWIEIDSQILTALFCVMGLDLISWSSLLLKILIREGSAHGSSSCGHPSRLDLTRRFAELTCLCCPEDVESEFSNILGCNVPILWNLSPTRLPPLHGSLIVSYDCSPGINSSRPLCRVSCSDSVDMINRYGR